MKEKVTFKWSNYFKPTPRNILYLVETLKGIVVGISVSSYINEHEKLAFYMLLSGAVLDSLAKFFSKVISEVE